MLYDWIERESNDEWRGGSFRINSLSNWAKKQTNKNPFPLPSHLKMHKKKRVRERQSFQPSQKTRTHGGHLFLESLRLQREREREKIRISVTAAFSNDSLSFFFIIIIIKEKNPLFFFFSFRP
jgi:hypothetical protein